MTRAEYEDFLTGQGIDPDFPIIVGKRYRVTGWNPAYLHKEMVVAVDYLSDTEIGGQVRRRGDNASHITSRWTRAMAERWTWIQYEEFYHQ
jgi:hypothetical protein